MVSCLYMAMQRSQNDAWLLFDDYLELLIVLIEHMAGLGRFESIGMH